MRFQEKKNTYHIEICFGLLAAIAMIGLIGTTGSDF